MTAGHEAEIIRRLDRLEALLLQVLQQQAQTTPAPSLPLEAEIQSALLQDRDIGAYFRERGRALPRQPRRKQPKTRRDS